MFTSKVKTRFVVFVISAFLLQLPGFTTEAKAKWHSKADELPGITTEQMILYVAAGVAFVLVFKALAKKSPAENEDKKETDEQEDSKDNQESYWKETEPAGDCVNSILATKFTQPAVLPYVGLQSLGTGLMNQGDLRNTAIVAGVSFNF